MHEYDLINCIYSLSMKSIYCIPWELQRINWMSRYCSKLSHKALVHALGQYKSSCSKPIAVEPAKKNSYHITPVISSLPIRHKAIRFFLIELKPLYKTMANFIFDLFQVPIFAYYQEIFTSKLKLLCKEILKSRTNVTHEPKLQIVQQGSMEAYWFTNL